MRHRRVTTALLPAFLLAGCAAFGIYEKKPSPTPPPLSDSYTPTIRSDASASPATGSCAAFRNQAEAQAALRGSPNDPLNLDPDGNGVACETLPPPRDEIRVTKPTPVPTAAPTPPPSPSPSPATSPGPSPSPSPSASPGASASPGPSPSPAASPGPSPSPTP